MRRKSAELIRFDQTFLLFEPFYCRLVQNDNFVFGNDTRSIQSKPTYMRRKLYSLTAGLAAALLLGAACSSDDTAENRFRNPQP